MNIKPAPISNKQSPEILKSREETFFSIFIATFTTVFIAELGDKTQIATLLLSAESGKPLIVFLGAALALITTSLIGVLIGRWLSTVVPTGRLEKSAGILMIGLSIWIGFQAMNSLFRFT